MGRAVVLALLLVLALPMGAAALPADGRPAIGSPAPAAAGTPETGAAGSTVSSAAAPSLSDVAILTLNDSARTSFATPSLDVATAMAVQHDAAASRLDRYALAERFRQTESTEARKALLFEAATAVEIRIASLREEERALRAAYAAREVDTGTFVRRLARIHARTAQLRTSLTRIQDHADEIPQFSLRRRVSLLDAALFGFEGPVRNRTLAALRGAAPPVRMYVSASERGAVISTVEDGRFVREAYRADNRDTETVGGMSLNEADQRTAELYPVAYNTTNNIRKGIAGLSGGLYRIDIELLEGHVTAYLDGATRNVFFEVQERRLDLLGGRPSVSVAANGTRLVVNRSYAGGPLHLRVVDNETGVPLQTTVVVGGHSVETGSAGTAWTLAPAGRVRVIAVGARGNVSVTVRPLAPTPVGGDG